MLDVLVESYIPTTPLILVDKPFKGNDCQCSYSYSLNHNMFCVVPHLSKVLFPALCFSQHNCGFNPNYENVFLCLDFVPAPVPAFPYLIFPDRMMVK